MQKFWIWLMKFASVRAGASFVFTGGMLSKSDAEKLVSAIRKYHARNPRLFD